MNILIIDDDETLGILFEHWLSEGNLKNRNITSFYVNHCEKGISLAREKHIDIVLMDVNLPDVNGFEGTIRFKIEFPEVMIIAISSDNQGSIQEKMLAYGAYDYLSKPIIEDIFMKRICTYIRIIELREKPIPNIQKSSLFDENVYNCKILFPIQHEDNLIEFWDAILTRFTDYYNIYYIHDTISNIYSFGLSLLQETNSFSIIIEENDENLYITLHSEKVFLPIYVNNLLLHYESEYSYFDNESKITLLLNKHESDIPCITPVLIKETPSIQEELPTAQEDILDSLPLETYDIFDEDEMEDFDSALYKMPLHMKKLQLSFNYADIDCLCIEIEHLCSILARYPEFNTFDGCLIDFVSILRANELKEDTWINLYPLINSYIEDIITWYKKIFFDGASSIHCLDDSFTANIELIQNILQPSQETNSVDDIFDF